MTPRLGDHFPIKVREDFYNRCLVRGGVLRFHTDITVPPKIKLFVVWGIKESLDRIGLSFINTEIKSIRNPHLKALQYPLLVKNNNFLKNDSFLDCSKIYELSLKTVRNLLKKKCEVFLGRISTMDLSTAEEIISNALTIEDILKERYEFV
jgi:hypothetical protein